MCRRIGSGAALRLQYHAYEAFQDGIKCGIPLHLCNSIR
jgi:hypothetical protein